MSNNKITQLNSLTSASLASNDLFVVVDVDATSTPTGETKNITSAELVSYVSSQSSGSGGVSSSYATYAETAGTSISSSHALIADFALSGTTDGGLTGTNVISVDTSGNDTTGDLDNAFATIGGAFDWLQGKRILSGSVEIHVEPGTYSYLASEELYHVDAQKISILGNGGDALPSTNAQYSTLTSQEDGIHTASIDVGVTIYNASSVGDYILITDVNTNTIGDASTSANTRALCGIWPIIKKGAGSVIDLSLTFQTDTIAPSRFSATPTLTAKLIKTKLSFSGVSGIVVDGCNLKAIKNLAIIGTSQSQTLNNGGDGLAVGQIKNTTVESVTDVDGFNTTRKGYASVVVSNVGVNGFAHAGFSARNGSLTTVYCSSTNNYYGFEADGGNNIDAPHCIANGNGHSGFFANNRSTINARYASACYNLYYGMVSDEGSSIICDNLSRTEKCTFVGPNGFTECLATNGSQLSMNGTFVRSYGSLSSSMQPTGDYYVIGSTNGSSVTSQYCKLDDLQNGIEARNNSVVVFDSSYATAQKVGALIVNGSTISLGNAEINKTTSNISYLIQLKNGSTANVPAFVVTSGGGTYSASFYLTNNSSMDMDGGYNYSVGKAPSEISELSQYSLTINNNESTGEQIWCDNNSVATIYELSGTFSPVTDSQLLATNGSSIRVKTTPSSSVVHYPNSKLPHGPTMGRISFDNMV